MTQFFRLGYYEYDKRKVRAAKQCAGCGCDLTNGYLSRKYCSPCSDERARARHDVLARQRYAAKKARLRRK